jgi:hypothetical protein
MEEFSAACDAVLQAERNLAAAKGEEYAVPIEFPVSWDTGAPLPYLLQSDYRTFLSFFLRDVDPGWDGTYARVRSPNDSSAERIALVEFERCICTKMGDPNDEVLHGHPLEWERACRIPSDVGKELGMVEGTGGHQRRSFVLQSGTMA